MGLWPKQLANSLPGRIMKSSSRATMGGTALLAALVMYLLMNFGTGFGTGSSNSKGGPAPESSGESTSRESASQTKNDAPKIDQATPTSLVPDSRSGGLSDDEKKALNGNVLTVLIDERSYFIEIPGQESLYRPTDLKRILELAKHASGDTNGIRVRVLRRETARASAEEQLKLDLARIGINSTAIYMSETLVP